MFGVFLIEMILPSLELFKRFDHDQLTGRQIKRWKRLAQLLPFWWILYISGVKNRSWLANKVWPFIRDVR